MNSGGLCRVSLTGMNISDSVITGLLGGLVAWVLMVWAKHGPPAGQANGAFRFSCRMRAVAILVFLIACVFGAFALALLLNWGTPQATPLQRALSYLICAGVMGWAIWFLAEVFFFEARIHPTHLEIRSPWRLKREIPWKAFRAARFSSLNHWYVLSTEGHGKVRLSEYLPEVEQVLARTGLASDHAA